MKKVFSILMAVLFIGTAFGQDAKAKAILDKVSSKTNAYKSIIINFDMIITPPKGEGEVIKGSGKAYLEGDKYKVELDDQDIYCDGKVIATHLKEDDECYFSSVADQEEGGIISPSELLTIWEDGYNYKYIQETTWKGRAVHHINLFPKNPKESKFFAIILKIDKEKNEVSTVLVKGKDGMNMKYILTDFKSDVTIPASTFTFNKAAHPNVECYDE